MQAKLKMCLVGIVLAVFSSREAEASLIKATYSGIVGPVYDAANVFSSDPQGAKYTATFLFDTSTASGGELDLNGRNFPQTASATLIIEGGYTIEFPTSVDGKNFDTIVVKSNGLSPFSEITYAVRDVDVPVAGGHYAAAITNSIFGNPFLPAYQGDGNDISFGPVDIDLASQPGFGQGVFYYYDQTTHKEAFYGQLLPTSLTVEVLVSAVPLPASAPMFAAALLVLAGFSYGLKRRAVLTHEQAAI